MREAATGWIIEQPDLLDGIGEVLKKLPGKNDAKNFSEWLQGKLKGFRADKGGNRKITLHPQDQE